MLRFAITDRRLGAPPGESPAERNLRMAKRSAELAAAGVDYLLIREKDLPVGELSVLTSAILAAVRNANVHTKVLSVGISNNAFETDGIHLSAASCTSVEVRQVMAKAIVSVSCHRLDEVEQAAAGGASLIVFAPIFGKTVDGQVVVAGVGLEMLRQACVLAGDVPVFALGGVTAANAQDCVAAGAAGVAGIRMFFGEDAQL